MPKKITLHEAIKRLRRAGRITFNAKDMTIFGNIVRDVRRKAFDKSMAPDGTKWAKLKKETIARKRKKGSKNPTKPLIDKGYLRMPTVESKVNEARVKIAQSREEIGPYHNEGGDNLPKREHWAVYPEAIKQIERMKEAIFERKIKQIFG